MSTLAEVAKKSITADQFWDYCIQPENEGKSFELIRGKLVEMPRPTRIHGIIQAKFAQKLGNWIDEIQRGYVATESGLILHEIPDTVVGPDVAYYTDADSLDEVHPKWGSVPPVLAVEILSENDRMSEVNERIADFLNRGIGVVRLVDPEDRKVSVYRSDRALQVLGPENELTDDLLPGFRCRVEDLFRLPKETSTSV